MVCLRTASDLLLVKVYCTLQSLYMLYTLCLKTTLMLHCITYFNAHQPILVIMAVLYVVEESHYVLPLYFILLLLLLFQTLFSEITERIPFILSHNIRSRCNLIMHPQKFLELYPHRKITQTPKNGHFGDRVRH